jgi:hypothetical protein
VTTEQDGTPVQAATSGSADDADEERADDDDDDADDVAQPAMADGAATRMTSGRLRAASRTDARWPAFSAA